MRRTSAAMEAIWRSGDYVGRERRPVARVTVQRPKMALRTYGMTSTFTARTPSASGVVDLYSSAVATVDPTTPSPCTNVYADYLFTAESDPVELASVRSVAWERTTDTETATCTVVLANLLAADPLTPGAGPPATIDVGGAYTFDHGSGRYASQWGQVANRYARQLMPDNLLRTYEGYGIDPDVAPEKDPHLLQTGLWIIDRVKLRHDAGGSPVLTITARDTMRLFADHFAAAPVIPADFYPLSFADWSGDFFRQRSEGGSGRVAVSLVKSSNAFWDPPNDAGSSPADAAIGGHRPSHALDEDPGTYWVSIGNAAPTKRYAYEWVEVACPAGGATVSSVRFRTKLTGYTAYASVMKDGTWQGSARMNYHRDGIGRNGADIAYLASGTVSSEAEHELRFPAVAGATRVRLTLSNLQNHGFGTFRYRAGLRSLQVWGDTTRTVTDTVHLTPGPAGSNPGRASDFTDLVKLAACWAGLHWPPEAIWRYSDGTYHAAHYQDADTEVLGRRDDIGRAWGDFQTTGTMASTKLAEAKFDKKPLLDLINLVRDITGFVLFADESGAVQWRLPNLYDLGNWVSGLSANPGRVKAMHVLDERQLLTSIDVDLDSRNVRETNLVASPAMEVAAVVGGFNPNPTGLRRIGMWTDSSWGAGQDRSAAQAEVTMAADMVSVRQLHTYRTAQATIPGFPGLQIDDQVQLVERTTSEGHVHYVKGISSTNDLRSGKWTYTLQTHWLGDDDGGWIIDRDRLSDVSQAFLDRVDDQGPPFTQTRTV